MEQARTPFSRASVLGILIVGFGAFMAILYFLAMGDPELEDSNNARAHAASNGMMGYSALVDLVEADGHEVTISRNPGTLETTDLLILTPPHYIDPEELTRIIDERENAGPTLIILPKWHGFPVNRFIEVEDPDKVRDGWAILTDAEAPDWADELEGPLKLDIKQGWKDPEPKPEPEVAEKSADDAAEDATGEMAPEELLIAENGMMAFQQRAIADAASRQRFRTRDPLPEISGTLPSALGFYATPGERQNTLVVDQEGRTIALSVRQYFGWDEEEGDNGEDYQWLVYVIEPDLMNNWGLSDEARARAAISLIRNMNYGDFDRVVFDVTLNGFGGEMNLLTLAFQPPFLAATICLLLAMLIIAWRAFLRFGPSAVPVRETAFGKARLVTNGADLILRAGRLKLLAEPFIHLAARRTARALGIARPDPDAIDAALAAREPQTPSFTARANELRAATKPSDILRAARALGKHLKKN